jgi:hypothetical protein
VHLRHEQPSELVKAGVDRIGHERFARDKFERKPVLKGERLECVLRFNGRHAR